jgi:hypothetical protein
VIWPLLLVAVGLLLIWSLCRAAREDEHDREAFEKARREAERIAGALESPKKPIHNQWET